MASFPIPTLNIPDSITSPQVASPLELAQKRLTLGNLMQQQQAGALQLKQAQQDWQDNQTMRQKWAEAGGDMNKFLASLAGNVSPNALFKLKQLQLDQDEKTSVIGKNKSEAEKNDQETKAKQIGAAYDTTGNLLALPDTNARMTAWGPARQRLIDEGHINPSDAPEAYPGDQWLQVHHGALATEIQRNAAAEEARKAALAGPQLAEANAKALTEGLGAAARTAPNTNQDDWFNWWKKLNPDVQAQISPQFSTVEYAKVQNMAVSPDERFKVKAPVGEFERDFLPSYAQKKGKTVDQLDPNERIAALGEFRVANADPEARAALLASRNLSEAMRQMQLNQMPTQEQANQLAGDLINHRIAPDQFAMVMGRDQNGALRRMVYTAAKKLDPDFNFEQASSEYQLTKSPGFQNTIRYIDYAKESLPRLLENAKKLANGNVASINNLVNAGKKQFEDVTLAAFNTDRIDVADAIAKILQGGGTGNGTTDAKLSQAQALIKESDNPAVIASTLGEIDYLMGKRRSTLTKGTYLEHVQNAASLPDPNAPAAAPRKNPFR